MTDLSQTIAPKSDQLNADDLIGRVMTITISGVKQMSEADQPIAISFEGDGGKPYKPCKSMRRVLVTAWGVDGNTYVGRRLTLFRDDKVQFGGVAVGGIRISRMSDIARDLTMALTATRAKRVPYTVRPLRDQASQPTRTPAEPSKRDRLYAAARDAARKGSHALREFRDALDPKADDALEPILPELDRLAADADADDGFPGDDAIRDLAATAEEHA